MVVLSKNWNALIKSNLKVLKSKEYVCSDIEKTFVIEPLERGFDMTLGNALRRTLLSSLQGAAIAAVKIDGILHEFSSLPGMKEDVTDLILNLKNVVIRMNASDKKTLCLNAVGPCTVTARMIETGHDAEVINPDYVLCHLDEGATLNMQLLCKTGKGYVSASHHTEEEMPVGMIHIDSLFSPVKKVAYKVANSRVGQVTDYGKLIITVSTNGSVTPDIALGLAARILQEQLQIFISFEEEQLVEEDKKDELPFDKNMLKKVDELELSVRSQNCLKNAEIVYVGDLVTKSEGEMLKTPNFGRKSLNEIIEILASLGLKFGLNVPEWPPKNIEELSKKYENPFE
ncbi:MAG: DNA-directed RNA polymerase subunit alpha [Rickettsiales bacterium]|nr:DNA-directed RNA polymerase subunit alpha [Rickettsiales bacterium]